MSARRTWSMSKAGRKAVGDAQRKRWRLWRAARKLKLAAKKTRKVTRKQA